MARPARSRDGDDDQCTERNSASYYENDGTGKFSNLAVRLQFNTNQQNRNPYPLDIDGDGDLDYIVSRINLLYPAGPLSPPTSQFVDQQLYINDRGLQLIQQGPAFPGQFSELPLLAASPGADGVTAKDLVGDYNGDGLMDLCVNSTLYLQNSSLGWVAQGASNLSDYELLRCTDVDGDGDDDFIGNAITSNDELTLLLNDGTGNFSPSPLPSPSQNCEIANLHDIDGDGDRDLIAVSGTSNALTIHLNTNGAYSLAQSIALPPQVGPKRTLVVADLDGNGMRDILFGHPDLVNLPPNSFREAAITYVAFQSQTSLVFEPLRLFALPNVSGVSDLDGDGDLDLTGATNARNYSFDGSLAGSRRQYGGGGPVAWSPLIGASGPFRAGETGILRLSRVRGGAFGVLTFGSQESLVFDFPSVGARAYNYPWDALFAFYAPGSAGEIGEGDMTVSAVFPPSLIGTTSYLQAAFVDASSPIGFTFTQGLELTIGQ